MVSVFVFSLLQILGWGNMNIYAYLCVCDDKNPCTANSIESSKRFLFHSLPLFQPADVLLQRSATKESP